MPNAQKENDFIVTPQRFSRLIEDAGVLKDTSTIAVAVSGGPDSMALLTMLAEWVGNRGVTLNALTVDHGLRSESAREAAQVAGWCGKLGIAHTILPWLGEKPGSGIPPEDIPKVIGKRAARDVAADELLAWSDLIGD